MSWHGIVLRLLAGVLGGVVSLPVLAQTIGGQATALDGDTLSINGQRIRLWGIDAPESQQSCTRGAVTYACGTEATKYLSQLISSEAMVCQIKTHDRYRRAVAVCMVRGRDAGADMVRAGWAMAFRQYSSDYVAVEAEARQAKRGVWQGTFEAPWDWRAARRQ